jgi:hypothetical protein
MNENAAEQEKTNVIVKKNKERLAKAESLIAEAQA